MSDAPDARVAAALSRLGVERLLLGIHDPSFPCDAGEDLGRGSPGTGAGRRLLAFARRHGFSGIQLGPQGLLSDGNPSPYDGCHFSRDTLSIPRGALEGGGGLPRLVRVESVERLVEAKPAGAPDRTDHRHAFAALERLLDEGFQTLVSQGGAARDEFHRWSSEQGEWLRRDAIFDWLRRLHFGGEWRTWRGTAEAELDRVLLTPPAGREADAARRLGSIEAIHGAALARYAFGQWLAHRAHHESRACASALGLELFGDLQIGYSQRDEWAARPWLLEGYRLGAPPSRTTPEGQPWNYPVLDPASYDGSSGGPGRRWVAARFEKLLGEFDGLRIDHPHGYVCPWVYRAGDEPFHAVRHGARLFESPALAEHPELARFARVGLGDLNPAPGTARFADDWVARLSAAQVDRYAVLVDLLVDGVRRAGRDPSGLVCEVLSTLPYPLKRVLERHGLGRFRVVQKANPSDPGDVYHLGNARPEDWVMLGNHDTPPIWSLVEAWGSSERRDAWVRELAARLAPGEPARAGVSEWLAADPGRLVHALFAALLASPARQVLLFWTDWFGERDPYNTPGTISDRNWSLRLTPDFAARHRELVARGRALDLPFAAALALRMAGATTDPDGAALAASLERSAAVPWPPPPSAEPGSGR